MSEVVLPATPTLEALRAQRDAILALAERYGAYNVRIFGSVARGDAKPDSDIDILMSFRENASIYDLSGLWQDLQGLLGHKVDLVTDDEQPRRQRFLRRILQDAVGL